MLSRKQAKSIYENFEPTYPHGQRLIEEIRQCDGLKIGASPAEQFDTICGHYFSSLQHSLPPMFPEDKRAANAFEINTMQAKRLPKKLLSDGYHIWSSTNRLLVPYFRRPGNAKGGDVDPVEFGVFFYTAERLIREGRLRIFNKIQAISRIDGEFPGYLIDRYGPEMYHKCVSGDGFRRFVSYGANLPHLTHGSPIEQVERYSVPLLGAAMRKDTYRMPQIPGKYVPLFLDYDRNNRRQVQYTRELDEPNYAGSILGVMQETLRGVQALEEYMLRAAAKGEVFLSPEEAEALFAEALKGLDQSHSESRLGAAVSGIRRIFARSI